MSNLAKALLWLLCFGLHFGSLLYAIRRGKGYLRWVLYFVTTLLMFGFANHLLTREVIPLIFFILLPAALLVTVVMVIMELRKPGRN